MGRVLQCPETRRGAHHPRNKVRPTQHTTSNQRAQRTKKLVRRTIGRRPPRRAIHCPEPSRDSFPGTKTRDSSPGNKMPPHRGTYTMNHPPGHVGGQSLVLRTTFIKGQRASPYPIARPTRSAMRWHRPCRCPWPTAPDRETAAVMSPSANEV